MRRRTFIAALGGAAAWPMMVRAQQLERLRLVGYLIGSTADDPQNLARVDAFVRALAQLGWTEGRNVKIEKRYASGDATRARALAKELVELRPDVILASPSPVVAALLAETQSIPIVFTVVADPVRVGFVASLARPGGNVTGFTLYDHAIAAKWLELLKEIAPDVNRVATMYSPAGFLTANFIEAIEAAATQFAVRVNRVLVNNETEVEAALAALGREAGGGLIAMPDIFNTTHRAEIIRAAALNRVPAIYPIGYWVKDGGLMSYGPDNVDPMPRAAAYVDRILRGEKPSDLPVQQPNKLEFLINLKTAKALGLTVPLALLTRGDEVIE